MSNPIQTILQAVQKHPLMMSPVLLEYLLRGEIIGRMAEKGLLNSPYHAALAGEKPHELTAAIAHCLEQGWLARTSGFYPALILTAGGELRLAAGANAAVEASPEQAYRMYYKWRQNTARTLRKPPYRIFPNVTVLRAVPAQVWENYNRWLEQVFNPMKKPVKMAFAFA